MDYSSDDKNFSDFYIYENLNKTIVRKIRTIRTSPNHFILYDDGEFIQRFRLSKLSAYRVLELNDPHITNKTHFNSALSEEQILLITLRLYATGGMLMTIGGLDGFSKSTISKIVARVTHCKALLKDHFIKLPESKTELLEAKKGFFNIAKFPKVIAAIDCTHIKIISPGGNDAEIYRNRRGFYPKMCKLHCDARLKITNIVVRCQRSAHDSNIFRNSKVYSRFESGTLGDGLILGDSGYKMTPILNPKNAQESLFNESQIRTRSCVERMYGVWKRRFPILSLGIRLNFKKVQGIIVATAVLHNIYRINNEITLPNLPNNLQEAVDFVSSVPNNRETRNYNHLAHRVLISDYFKKIF